MTIAIFETKSLNLPRDVQRPDELIINGELTGADNEVVVILQLRRAIKQNAYVCHITDGKCGRGIYDLPGFRFLEATPWTQKKFEGITFTMACTAETQDWRPRTNWLW